MQILQQNNASANTLFLVNALAVSHADATLARHGRQHLLHIKTTAPWADLVVTGHSRLAAVPP